jgi:hypothetical protein
MSIVDSNASGAQCADDLNASRAFSARVRMRLRERGLLNEYKVWNTMIRRCYLPNDRCFQWYGGRGITVCDRWLESFDAFIADMGRRPVGVRPSGRSLWTIERNDSDGNYEPKNCRWAHYTEQVKTQRQGVDARARALAAKRASIHADSFVNDATIVMVP